MPNDQDSVDDFNTDTDNDPIERRLAKVDRMMTRVNKRLEKIEGQIPPGPPVTPQATLLESIITSSEALIVRARAILSRQSP